MNAATKAKMIDRAVRIGYNRAERTARLEEILANHSGLNLAYCLTYEGYATEAAALKAVAA